MKSRKKDEIDLFKEFVVSRGGEIMAPTSQWEAVRFRGHVPGNLNMTHIVYVNAKGEFKFHNGAQIAFDAYRRKDQVIRFAKRHDKTRKSPEHRSVEINTLIARDGDVCFYCGGTFSEENPRTKEHLVARTHSGPDHISNIFLSCPPCNAEAGHLSAPEKIRLRDQKRRGRGSKLLADVLATGAVLTTDIMLAIRSFLHEASHKETT